MKKILLFASCLIFAAVGNTQTTVVSSFDFDGAERTYKLYIPDIYDGTQPAPLVFNLHGYGSNNLEQEVYGDFRPIADTANFIIVHPMGLTDDLGTNHWNTFGTSSVDDVGFLSALIDTIYANYNIDGNRIYSTGMSNGGFMSYKLACLLSGRIAAIASVTGAMTPVEFDACITNHPMPVMEIHGTADGTVPYEGNLFFMATEDIVNHWVAFNECDTEPIVTEIPDTDPDDGCTATHFVYENGLLGSTVEFYRINDGEHTWPGSAFGGVGTNNDFNASEEIWRFFSQYTLNFLTSGIETNVAPVEFMMYPNPSNQSEVTLSFKDNAEKKITVHNSLGQVVLETTETLTTVQLDIADKGIFFVTINQNGVLHTEKLVRN
ncbi:MAG: T9SS type A sorting domain-containing protein [Crocinitomix sp.]|nr:T9SS type A sorting domain-containing protein [Crocinitomix sp.]